MSPTTGRGGDDGSVLQMQSEPIWHRWVEPPTIIAIVAAAATVYGTQVLQTERVEALRVQVERIEREYQRRDVLAEQLRSINERLYGIERTLGSDRSTTR